MDPLNRSVAKGLRLSLLQHPRARSNRDASPLRKRKSRHANVDWRDRRHSSGARILPTPPPPPPAAAHPPPPATFSQMHPKQFIFFNLRSELKKIDGHEEVLIEMLNQCVDFLERGIYVTPDDK